MSRKIISYVLVCIFTFWNIPFISASDTSNNYIHSRDSVVEWSYGRYIEELEKIVPQLNSEKLEEIISRIEKKEASENNELEVFLDFIHILISSELENRIPLENISLEEKQDAEKEILVLQKAVGDSLNEIAQALIVLWDTESHYEETGNLKMDMNMNIQDFLEYSLSMQLDNYKATVQWLDSSFSARTGLQATMENEYDFMNIIFNGDVEMISKDGSYYLSIPNADVNEKNVTIFPISLEKIFEKMEVLAQNNTYLEISDNQTLAALEIIQNFSPSQIEATLNSMSENLFFEAYSKKNGAYLLRPTQEFCSYMKKSVWIFDIFHGQECSEKQYKDMLENFSQMWVSLELQLGTNNTLSIIIDHEEALGKFDIIYNQYGLIKISGDLTEPGNEEINHISLSFIPEESLSINIDIENEIHVTTDMKLKKNNALARADIHMLFDELQVDGVYNSWKLHIDVKWILDGETIQCELWGEMNISFIDIEWGCSFVSTSYFSGKEDTYIFNGKMTVDRRNERNNVYFLLDGKMNQEELLSLSLTNKANRKLTTQKEILAPKNTQAFSEFMDELQEEFYDNTYESSEQDYYYEDCYEYEGVEYCDIDTNEYYYDAYNNIYYYNDYEYDVNTWEYFYYEEY